MQDMRTYNYILSPCLAFTTYNFIGCEFAIKKSKTMVKRMLALAIVLVMVSSCKLNIDILQPLPTLRPLNPKTPEGDILQVLVGDTLKAAGVSHDVWWFEPVYSDDRSAIAFSLGILDIEKFCLTDFDDHPVFQKPIRLVARNRELPVERATFPFTGQVLAVEADGQHFGLPPNITRPWEVIAYTRFSRTNEIKNTCPFNWVYYANMSIRTKVLPEGDWHRKLVLEVDLGLGENNPEFLYSEIFPPPIN